jgi:excisionase family DNA binding protein
MERWLTVREVARQVALSEPTVRRLVHDGTLEAMRPTPRAIRVAESAVVMFLERAQRRGQRNGRLAG